MCDFCDVLTSDDYDKKIRWSVRSTMADDNIEEVLEEKTNYSECWIERYSDFKLYGYTFEGNVKVGIHYRKQISNGNGEVAIVNPFSETIQFNFCPICGEKISESVKEFGDYHNHIISIE